LLKSEIDDCTVFYSSEERRIFGPKRDVIIGGWKKFHIEEHHNLCFSPYIMRMTKSRRIILAGLAARIREKRKCT
jgi:hypothetical protein